MLKKIAILTAAAGMLSTSMAVLAEGPTVYGRIAVGFGSVSGETDAVDSQEINDQSGYTRFGIKGTNDLGNGMSVDYLLEYDTAGDDDSDKLRLRHSNITLNGSFGQFRLGQQTGVLYRYIGANTDQSWNLGGSEYYAIAGGSADRTNLNSSHSLRMSNIAAYRFGAGPGGDDPITFDIQIQSVDMSKAAVAATPPVEGVGDGTADSPITTTAVPAVAHKAAMDDGETIDSVTFAAATALGPVKLQVAYVDENGSEATGDRSPSLLSLGFRAPLGSAEVRGHMTSVDTDMDNRDDNEAWGLLVMNDFGGGYSGMIGVGSFTDGGKGGDGAGSAPATNRNAPGYTAPVHKNAGDMTNAYVSLTKSFGGGLSAFAEYSTVTKTVTKAIPAGQDVEDGFTVDDDEATTNTFNLYLVQSF